MEGKLPPGVKFTGHADGTATISGTPSGKAAGTYPMTLTAKNKSGTATQDFVLTVNRPPAWKKAPNIRAEAGSAVHQVITATGFPVPALAESGSLPDGLTFTDNAEGSATISGTPAAGTQGSYSITVTATNSLGTANHSMTIRVK